MATISNPKTAAQHFEVMELAKPRSPSTPTPQPSEPEVLPLVITPVMLDPKGSPGTTREELATRDQWEPACNCAAGQSAAPLWHLAGCPMELPPDD